MPKFKVVTRRTVTNTFCLIDGESLEAVEAYWREHMAYLNSVEKEDIYESLNTFSHETFELVSVEESLQTAYQLAMKQAIAREKMQLAQAKEAERQLHNTLAEKPADLILRRVPFTADQEKDA